MMWDAIAAILLCAFVGTCAVLAAEARVWRFAAYELLAALAGAVLMGVAGYLLLGMAPV